MSQMKRNILSIMVIAFFLNCPSNNNKNGMVIGLNNLIGYHLH